MSGPIKLLVLVILLSIFSNQKISAQFGIGTVPPEISCINQRALEFLITAPDALAGGIGGTGIVIDDPHHAIHFNASKLSNDSSDYGISFSYLSLRNKSEQVNPALFYFSSHKKLNDHSTIALSWRSLKNDSIAEDDNYLELKGQELAFAFARKLSGNFSGGITAKYLESERTTTLGNSNHDISNGTAFALDFSFSHQTQLTIGSKETLWSTGLTISNLGRKISYSAEFKEYLPANLGLGTALMFEISEHHHLSLALDWNKLMVPVPISSSIDHEYGQSMDNPAWDSNANNIPDYQEYSALEGIVKSWNDEQGSFMNELKQSRLSFGIVYKHKERFQLRSGYSKENLHCDEREFVSFGTSLYFKTLRIDLAYSSTIKQTEFCFNNGFRLGLNLLLNKNSSSKV